MFKLEIDDFCISILAHRPVTVCVHQTKLFGRPTSYGHIQQFCNKKVLVRGEEKGKGGTVAPLNSNSQGKTHPYRACIQYVPIWAKQRTRHSHEKLFLSAFLFVALKYKNQIFI